MTNRIETAEACFATPEAIKADGRDRVKAGKPRSQPNLLTILASRTYRRVTGFDLRHRRARLDQRVADVDNHRPQRGRSSTGRALESHSRG